MKVLFIGGSGVISSACTSLALENGIDLYLLNRGLRANGPTGAKQITADIKNPAEVKKALGNLTFDAVVNWIAFTPADVERDVELFQGRTAQYIFISSASAYQKPLLNYRITEDTPLVNPFWEYSRNKIASEETVIKALRDKGFPGVIVRPSLTYGETLIPLVLNSWGKSYTAVARMKRGEPVIVPGDGTSLWTITHNSDFAKGLVGLLGQRNSIGQSFHITSDEVLTWDQYYQTVAEAVGVKANIIHIASDFIAVCLPGETGGLHGDKTASAIFDNSKIKRFVPTYQATTSFATGIRKTLAWFDADKSRQIVDTDHEQKLDKIIRAYESGLKAARQSFA